ncbi:MAG: TIGR00303 family protein [Candidatus Melainabacteria bacterium RIFCSPLOWO2_02_FULL_35_15]|nr:MAG: TIGR00303 family protein [Candidatus Melainabacteria bacterium RIFCSPLOWO2_12_FULL_35_11]OGI13199.1 MAG: TIGR00303 family protein [Candidatus Melainabacteria bacterium RIFCSPLOWO2_02_FULL_35_15]
MLNTTTEQISHKKIKSYSFISKSKECQNFINKVNGKKPLFILVIGSTETALIPGISAAGQNIEQLKHTPALDADFLVSRLSEFNKNLPISPSGIPSPAILSKAMIELLDLDINIIDVGAFIKPEKVHIDLNMGPGKCLTTGLALGPVKTSFLFQKGEKLGLNLSNYPYVVIGECVPGGTATALSVLCSLEINAFDLVSSSFPEGNHLWKNQTVRDALLNNADKFSGIKKNPLKAIEHFGDPMQVFLCGFIKGAQKANLPVMLAGGSQMLAVYYVSKLLTGFNPYDTVVATTSWITNDKNAKTKRLAELVSAPLISSNINFKESKYKELYAYEEGHIKEGVGAGGLMVAADLYKEITQEEIVLEIEKLYAQIHK